MLLENNFSALRGKISGEITNAQFAGKSSGILNGWQYKSYNWDSIYFNVDLLNEKLTYFELDAISTMGDKIQFSSEQESSGDVLVTAFAGSLKKTELNIQPFYINKRDDYFHFPQIKISLGDSEMKMNGNYQGKNHYEIDVDIQNFQQWRIY